MPGSWDQINAWNIAWARNYSWDPCLFLINVFFLSPFLPQVLYWLLVSKHLARVNIFFALVLKVEEISFGFLDFCTLLQPCIVTQDIRVSAYTLAIKVQNSEALKTAGSWKCNISLAIFKDSWQRDFNTIQCHTLEEKLNFAENTTTAKCSYLIQLISKIVGEMAWSPQSKFFLCPPVQNKHQAFSISVSTSDISNFSKCNNLITKTFKNTFF